MLTNVINHSTLNGLDRLLGLCFGLLRGLLIIIALTIGFDLFIGDEAPPKIVNTSKTIDIIFDVKEDFKNQIPNSKPEWIVSRFDTLMGTCNDSSIANE